MPVLNWLTRDEDIQAVNKVPYRLLEEVPKLSAGDGESSNMLIQGDNLDALKALLPFYAGKVKCIYIDPPYNTRSAEFEHFDDNLEHSQWLAMMCPRLQLLRELLARDGVIFVHIDDREQAYLKVLMDEIYGRKNFCGQFVWEKKKKPSFLNTNVGVITEYILAYSTERKASPPFLGGVTTEGKKYPLNNAGNGIHTLTFPPNTVLFKCEDGVYSPQDMSKGKIITKLKTELHVHDGTNENEFSLEGEWRYSQKKLDEIIGNNERLVISKVPFRPNHVKSGGEKKKMKNLLLKHEGMATYEDSNAESQRIFGTQAFKYPKPELLIATLLSAVTEPGDLVLDSFLGSGTTVAVAHKMGRSYIGIELGDHARTHCALRLRKVIEGEQGGISESVRWRGGGGFRFYDLGDSVFDENGQINPNICFSALASHIWFYETGCPWDGSNESAFLGIHDRRAYALLYNGILGDKRPNGGNVLTSKTLILIREIIAGQKTDFIQKNKDYSLTIYGERSQLQKSTLDQSRVTFKLIPYDIKTQR